MSESSMPKSMDQIKFTWKGREMEGVVISTKEEMINIKLPSGYNIYVKPEKFEITGKVRFTGKKIQSGSKSDDQSISVISTGGTIASRVDYKTGAVFPSMDMEDLTSRFRYMNTRRNLRNVDFSNILSENMEPQNWIDLARVIQKELARSEGVVVTHGTDTMTYTSSALSFLFESQTGPIILTGSQRSSDRPSSDSYLNLEASVAFASEKMGEVGICMHKNTSDEKIQLIRGTRARKMHSTRRDAFRSIGTDPLGIFEEGLTNLTSGIRQAGEENIINTKLEKKVGLIYFYPGLETETLEKFMDGKKGIVIMGTGLGHIAVKYLEILKERISDEMKVMTTTQCIFGTVNLDVYSTGRRMKDAGIVWCGNMLPETAYVKMMYVLGNYGNEDFERIMNTNLRGEIVQNEQMEAFP